MELKIGDEVIYRYIGGNFSGIREGDRGKIVDYEDGSPVVEWFGKGRAACKWLESSLIPVDCIEKMRGSQSRGE